MVRLPDILTAHVIWKDRKFLVELSSDASLKDLGEKLQALTDVKADTIRLIIPQSSTKSSKLFMPFSNEHSYIRLQDTGIGEGKPLRMMGVYEHEVDQLLKDAKANLRIAGFEDEEKRMKQRISRGPQASFKLPQGPYIFCDFRTLELPGIQLNPIPSEALKRMHMLASDPGIVAIMNKHRWRVGIMTEMAPVGYVGISPKCLLGFNKNHGEEISLRLRTDDLKGFRKYETIKKTLLHELAHMVYSEHDSKFYALDKLLNQEAFALNWTRSRSHTLSDAQFSGHDDMDVDFELESSLPQKLGGETSSMPVNAREASVVAAYHRLADSSITSQVSSLHEEQASDDYASETHGEYKSVSSGRNIELLNKNNHDSSYHNHEKQEPDPDDSGARNFMHLEPCPEINEGITKVKNSLNATWMGESVPKFTFNGGLGGVKMQEEPDPDDSEFSDVRVATESHVVDSQSMQFPNSTKSIFKITDEPDPDELEARRGQPQLSMVLEEPNPDGAGENRMEQVEPEDKSEILPQIMGIMTNEPDPNDFEARCQLELTTVHVEPGPHDAEENRMEQAEPDPDDKSLPLPQIMGIVTNEPDPDDQELRRIQDPVNVFCNQLTKAIEKLRCDLGQSESKVVLETLFKIMRNVLEKPNEMRYKKLRKANPTFQRSVVNHKAGMEVLFLIGFSEEVVVDETGKSETYITLKRNDPGLLWLAKSTLETYIS